jgi:hypothetical protein
MAKKGGDMKRLILASLLTICACDKINGPVAFLDRSFGLDIGETKIIEPGHLRITFKQVLSDNRCPIGAECVVAGQAEPEFLFKVSEEDSARVVLVIGPYITREDTLNHPAVDTLGYRIKLQQLDPHPDVTSRRPVSEYRALLRISALDF